MVVDTPGGRRWCGHVVDALASGRNVIAVFPATLDPTPQWDAIRTELWRRLDARIGELDLPEISGPPEIEAMSRALGLWTPRLAVTPERVMAHPDLPTVVVLHGLEQLKQPERASWLALTARLARAGQAGQESSRCGFLCLVRGVEVVQELPDPDVHVAIQWWWGVPTALEMRLACRLREEEGGDIWTRAWREHVLPSVSGGDPGLATWLWDAVLDEEARVRQRLIEYATRQGWSVEALEAAGVYRVQAEARGRGGAGDGLPRGWRQLWALGALLVSDEFGVEVSSAALALLGQHVPIAHRLWRGQVSLLLPQLDVCRLEVCADLHDRYGPGWPQRFGLPVNADHRALVQANPFAAEWGYLLALHRDHRELRRDDRRDFLVRRSWSIRNELAHHRPVTYAAARRFWEARGAFLETGERGQIGG